jgi:hypothetical protein
VAICVERKTLLVTDIRVALEVPAAHLRAVDDHDGWLESFRRSKNNHPLLSIENEDPQEQLARRALAAEGRNGRGAQGVL